MAAWHETRVGRGGYGGAAAASLLTGTVTASPSAGNPQAETAPTADSPPGSGETQNAPALDTN